MDLAIVKEEALRLSPSDREALVEALWESLESPAVLNRKQRWADEAEERIDAFDRGDLGAVDGPRAIQELRRSLPQ